MSEVQYRSTVPFESLRIHAAAVYCSDGRFGEQFDDFIQNGLGLPRYDRLAIPGGAACLAGHFSAFREQEVALRDLQFLSEVHGLERVILVSHQGCAFYLERLKTPDQVLEARQREDLLAARERVASIASLQVDAFFARCTGEQVSFEAVRE